MRRRGVMKSVRSRQVAFVLLLFTVETLIVSVTFSTAASLCFIVMLEWMQAAFSLAGRPDT